MMTPIEIAEYKNRWLREGTAYSVPVHIDLTDRAKTWCRRQLERHQWSVTTYTDVYKHTFFFEDPKAGQNFQMELQNKFKD